MLSNPLIPSSLYKRVQDSSACYHYPYFLSKIAALSDAEYFRFLCGLGYNIFMERCESVSEDRDNALEIGQALIGEFRYELNSYPTKVAKVDQSSNKRKPDPLLGVSA